MQLTTETFGNVLVAHTPDEVTEDQMRNFVDTLQTHINEQQYQIVLQMDRTEAYDSAGLTSLVELRSELQELGGNLKICGLEEPGKTIFTMTRLNQQFEVFDSIIDAVGSFN